jgi:hypothetical protein
MADERLIPPPSPDRPPLKVNVLERARTTATTLAPLFPYVDEGSIVPCISVFRGGPGRRYGRFQHLNSVDEVIVMLDAPAGLVLVGPKLHPVAAPFEDVEDPENSAISLITQRQLFGKPHHEEYRFLCDACDRRLSVARFDATPPARGSAGPPAPFPTLVEGCAAARRHNADEESRRCKHCGHLNEPFPLEAWGWEEYTEQSAVSERARASMQAASADPAAGE